MAEPIDLVQYISPAGSFCLNEHNEHNFRNALLAEQRVDSKVFLQSDCDEASARLKPSRTMYMYDGTLCVSTLCVCTLCVIVRTHRVLAGTADTCRLLAERAIE